MRKGTKSKAFVDDGIHYGADTSGFNADNAPEFIRNRAYQLFEMRGRGAGHELDDWLQAEKEIRSRFQI